MWRKIAINNCGQELCDDYSGGAYVEFCGDNYDEGLANKDVCLLET